jgi:hypothetical protein
MEPLKTYKTFKISKTGELKSLVDEVYKEFGFESKFYWRLYKMIEMYGIKSARELFEKIKKIDFTHKKQLFIKELGKDKTIWK